ncbi:hypothetical protein PO878_02075 [Iamia majanohamensis]|uniref:Aminoglycoside phosphotransferase n=1 Tax=Iamia majanohamensis TaxID=467976 RepID=A0AAF0BS08_9ACTN|nr:hypothetical protein [Iamia majanohamensis]WCO67506.1 hypothetical protein PO878_02075 [Iamia majanohamensis]
MAHDLDRLDARQRQLLLRWLPDLRVEADHSWGLVETTVLEVVADGRRLIVKAGGPTDHHLARELHAHRHWLGPWRATGRAATLLHGDAQARILVATFVPGRLVLGTPAQDEPDTYVQAGRLLAALHGQTSEVQPTDERASALRWLDRDHRIDPSTEARLRAEIEGWPTTPTTVVPTHGDWQPRNWLVEDGVVRAIDLGRAALRSAMSDLVRLAAQDFRRRPELEAAFLAGYGPDPREPGAWRRHRVREAIGTAVWAHQVGDAAFEAQGHRMIAEALAAT